MKTKTSKLVAEICLYGNGKADVGYGWLARTNDGAMLGTGDPIPGKSATHCVFEACEKIGRLFGMCGARPRGGIVRIFAAGGERMADTSLSSPAYYGDLQWMPATALVVSAEAIEAAASK